MAVTGANRQGRYKVPNTSSSEEGRMRQLRTGLLLVVGAAILVACASKAPVNSTGATSAGSASATKGAADATAPDTGATPVPKGYRRVMKHGGEYFCRMQAVSGSHVQKTEVCLTQDELDAELAHHTAG
jgi:hypothetical protein